MFLMPGLYCCSIGRTTIMTQMMYLALALTHEVVALFL